LDGSLIDQRRRASLGRWGSGAGLDSRGECRRRYRCDASAPSVVAVPL